MKAVQKPSHLFTAQDSLAILESMILVGSKGANEAGERVPVQIDGIGRATVTKKDDAIIVTKEGSVKVFSIKELG